MGLLREFRDFAARGNAIDLAVGVVIGAAFGKIVTSLVDDIITPPLGLLLGNSPFSDLKFPLGSGDKPATINYGTFLQATLNFLIVAAAIFLLVKVINRVTSLARTEEAPAAPTTKECPRCCSTIPIRALRCPACTSELAA